MILQLLKAKSEEEILYLSLSSGEQVLVDLLLREALSEVKMHSCPVLVLVPHIQSLLRRFGRVQMYDWHLPFEQKVTKQEPQANRLVRFFKV
jgi:hypothetical protein